MQNNIFNFLDSDNEEEKPKNDPQYERQWLSMKPIMKKSTELLNFRQYQLAQKRGLQHSKIPQKIKIDTYFSSLESITKKRLLCQKIMRQRPSRVQEISCMLNIDGDFFSQIQHSKIQQCYDECYKIIQAITRSGQTKNFKLWLDLEEIYQQEQSALLFTYLKNITRAENLYIDIKRLTFNQNDCQYIFRKIFCSMAGTYSTWKINYKLGEQANNLKRSQLAPIFHSIARNEQIEALEIGLGGQEYYETHIQKIEDQLAKKCMKVLNVCDNEKFYIHTFAYASMRSKWDECDCEYCNPEVVTYWDLKQKQFKTVLRDWR